MWADLSYGCFEFCDFSAPQTSPSRISALAVFSVSCIVPRVSCLVPRVSCLFSYVSCLVTRASCLVPRVLCLVSRVWSLVSCVSCLRTGSIRIEPARVMCGQWFQPEILREKARGVLEMHLQPPPPKLKPRSPESRLLATENPRLCGPGNGTTGGERLLYI